jgi:hypothetical protein
MTHRDRSMRAIACAILVVAACQPGDTVAQEAEASPDAGSEQSGVELTGSNSNFLVKLTSSMSAESSEPADPVTAVVIAPEPLRGGTVEGTIRRADRGFLSFSFHTLHFEGESYAIESEITSVVNSKGNLGQDDLGQRIRVAGGDVIAYGTTTAIDEGAEVRFVGWNKEQE